MPRAIDASEFWTFMFYNEHNELETLVSELSDLGIKYCYIFHDKDIDPKSDVGDLKKAHYHFVLRFPDKVGSRAVRSGITGKYQGIPKMIKRLLNPRKMIEYLTHKNQPEKYQYPETDIKWGYGTTIDDFPDKYLGNSKERKKKEDMTKTLEILQLIEDKEVKTLFQLSKLLKDDPEKLMFVVDHSFYFDRVLSVKVSTQCE